MSDEFAVLWQSAKPAHQDAVARILDYWEDMPTGQRLETALCLLEMDDADIMRYEWSILKIS